MKFSNQNGRIIADDLIKAIQANRDYLSTIDGAIGDGDHGINMNKGFTMAAEELKDKDVNMSHGLMTISRVLVSKIGGSMGPLYGSLFLGMSVASKNEDFIDSQVFGKMINKAYSNLKEITPARVGDKTLIDVLDPAVKAYDTALTANKNFLECLEAMTVAANNGLESTKNMVAKLGRAGRLGERSLGHQDAGATSCCIILSSLAKSIATLIQ